MLKPCKSLFLAQRYLLAKVSQDTSAPPLQVPEICFQAQYVQVAGREEHQALHVWAACVFNTV